MTTRTSRRAPALGGAALVLAAASGCGQGAPQVERAPSSTAPASTAPSSTAPSPAARSSEAAAEDAVRITAPAPDAHLPAGVVGVTGTGTAPEGTLLWRITDASGTVVGGGHTAAGANGEVSGFSVEQAVQPGTCAPCTVRVWVPDDSDGEGSPARAATRAFWVD